MKVVLNLGASIKGILRRTPSYLALFGSSYLSPVGSDVSTTGMEAEDISGEFTHSLDRSRAESAIQYIIYLLHFIL